MSNDAVIEILEKAQADLENGDKASAVEKFKEAIELDPSNVDIWQGLAELLDDVDEKRIALTTLLQLDPDNEYAKAELEETEKEESEIRDAEEVVPGITRREARTIGLGLVLFTFVVCGIVMTTVIGTNSAREAERAEIARLELGVTQTAESIANNNTQVAMVLTQESSDSTATAQASITPTLTPTRTPDLPTEIPPTATPTEVEFQLFDRPPNNIVGNIIAYGGRNPQSDEFLNTYQITLGANFSNERMNGELIQSPTVDGQFTRLIYTRLIPQGGTLLTEINPRSPRETGIDLSANFFSLGIREASDPDISFNGSTLVFSAVNNTDDTQGIFRMDLASREVILISTDPTATYRQPTVSPDGAYVVAVKETGAGADLVLIEVATSTEFPVTADGISLTEANPKFNADGTQVIFNAYASSPTDNDIYIVRLAGTVATPALPVITSNADEVMPVLNPQSTHIAFASNVSPDAYNLFILEIATGTTYQVTVEMDDYFPTGWVN